jgi:type IV pilus assembly protein PilX
MQSAPGAREQGMVLIIALIVLVAMTLAGIGMVRSVDTANVIAGNLAFKQGTLQTADTGVNAGFNWLIANAGGTTVYNDNPAGGYFSAQPGYPEPDWSDADVWTNLNAACVNACTPDPATGTVVRYVIHRMCTEPNTSPTGTGGTGAQNQCGQSFGPSGASPGGSKQAGAFVFQGNPYIFYRITARADGPRNTSSVVQTTVSMPQ